MKRQKNSRSFASDNNAGVHPEIVKAIIAANEGHVVGYGDDSYTESAVKKFREHFGNDVQVFFVFNGTAANVLSLKALTDSYHAVICAETAHIYTDECAAPEKFTGCKLIPLPTSDGKLTMDSVRHACHGIGDQHHVQPRVISITQATEMGTVYQPAEIRALADFAHQHDMFLHMDGARIANAAASLDQTLGEATRDVGVDVLSFGGTKNGLMGAEAVVFLNPEVVQQQNMQQTFLFIRKQGMQLASKMRFMAAQMEAILSNDLWLTNARHSNRMAKLLQKEVSRIPQVKIVYKVQANGVFAQIPKSAIAPLQQRYFFYPWNEDQGVVRWMCSFDTTEQDIKDFGKFLREVLNR